VAQATTTTTTTTTSQLWNNWNKSLQQCPRSQGYKFDTTRYAFLAKNHFFPPPKGLIEDWKNPNGGQFPLQQDSELWKKLHAII
jgi:hypothetical protein